MSPVVAMSSSSSLDRRAAYLGDMPKRLGCGPVTHAIETRQHDLDEAQQALAPVPLPVASLPKSLDEFILCRSLVTPKWRTWYPALAMAS